MCTCVCCAYGTCKHTDAGMLMLLGIKMQVMTAGGDAGHDCWRCLLAMPAGDAAGDAAGDDC